MKKLILFLLLAVGLIGSASASVLLEDNFSDNSLDTSKWNLNTPLNNQTIYNWTGWNVTSSAVESGDVLTLKEGASIYSKQVFTSPYIFSGTFTQLQSDPNPGPVATIYLKTDGSPTDQYASLGNSSIAVRFGQYGLSYANIYDTSYSFELGLKISYGKSVSFSVTDWGDRFDLYVDGSFVTSENYIDSSYGNHIGISSSWGDYSGLQISNLKVTSVPEPSTYALFGLGAIGMLMVLRKKKTA